MAIHSALVPCEIKDLALAEPGKRRIEWTFQSMPVLASIRKQFIKTQTFSGVRIAARLPITASAANLFITLRDGGAKIWVWGSDAHSTEDDVAASLVKDYQIPVFAMSTGIEEDGPSSSSGALAQLPQLLMDHTGELTVMAIGSRTTVQGAIVTTREGARRFKPFAAEGRLRFPVMAAHRSLTRRVFYSRIGTGQSVLETVLRSMNVLIAGLNVVIIGFGRAGRGIAKRAKGLGATVIVTEIDPIRALEAAMEGYRVLSMADAAAVGELFVATSGGRNVVGREHFDKLRNGAILTNVGHSDLEFDMGTLALIAGSRKQVRADIEEWAMRDGRRIYLMAGGRSMRQTMEDSLPVSVLDLTFANWALSAEYLLKNRESLRTEVYGVPLDIDQQVARLKLEAMGIKIDRLTVEQEQYLANLSE